MTTDPSAARAAVDLLTGAWRAQAVHVATRLGLPDLIAAGRTTGAALAEATGTDTDALHRLLRLLVILGVLEGGEPDGYRNSAVGDLLRDRPGSLRDLSLLYGEEFYRAWSGAEHALRTGRPAFEQEYGQSLIAYLGGNQEAAGRFQRAMQGSNFFFERVPEVFDFAGRRLVVDIGGGSGQLLSTVLAAAPDAHGVLVDLPHVLPIARAHLAATVGEDRVRLVGQDMFEGPLPEGADAYLLSRVLGDWDEPACLRLLAEVRAVMRADSRLLVLERVVREDGTGPLAALWDVHLLVVNGGRQRTLDEYHTLFGRSGLAVERIEELPMENSVLVVAPER
ncbi:methyltransferase [Kitasatospora sp. NPDC001175]|uniref:methyltransferase n=1 Tax=Kitasatospora sp. NPDC001175 TaxID=3157103 RepID=UPI003D018928